MNERGACLRCGGGDGSLGALDDAIQGFSFGRRRAGSLRAPLVRGAIAGLLLLVTVVGFAACGGGDSRSVSPTATGVVLPPGFSEEQAKAALQMPNVADETQPLANLVSQRTLSGQELRAAVNEDPQFAELEALAKSAGFGPAGAALELQYDNDMKVTAAILDSRDGGLALAAREAGAKPVYAVLHLAPDVRTVTVYNSEGTVTVDLESLKGSAVDAPGAQHGCRTGHCIYAALLWLAQSWYGPGVQAACGGCISSIAPLAPAAGAAAVVTIPSCIVCIPALTATGISTATVCYDDPCSYCVDNTCGDPPLSREERCVSSIGPPDPVTGISASVTGADAGYRCVGVVEKPSLLGVELGDTECVYNSGPAATVRACPYGCAAPPPGDWVSHDCAPPPAGVCKSDADCPAEQVKNGPTCTPNPEGAPAAWVRTEYEYYRCQDSRCVAQTRTAEVGCSYGCAADGKSCGCPEQDEAVGGPRCVFRPDDQQWIIEQDYRHYYSTPGGLTCGSEQITRFEEACPSGCAADSKSCAEPPLPACDPATCEREEASGDPRCVRSPSGYVLEQPYLDYFCKPLAGGGSKCESSGDSRVTENCPYGCAPDGKSCATMPPASGVPVAPSDFLVVEHSGGTYFEWTDNSLNEDGFRIYFGGASVGRPGQLIITVGPDEEKVDTDFVRSGTGICWEIHAFNERGESAPAWYCLPP